MNAALELLNGVYAVPRAFDECLEVVAELGRAARGQAIGAEATGRRLVKLLVELFSTPTAKRLKNLNLAADSPDAQACGEVPAPDRCAALEGHR